MKRSKQKNISIKKQSNTQPPCKMETLNKDNRPDAHNMQRSMRVPLYAFHCVCAPAHAFHYVFQCFPMTCMWQGALAFVCVCVCVCVWRHSITFAEWIGPIHKSNKAFQYIIPIQYGNTQLQSPSQSSQHIPCKTSSVPHVFRCMHSTERAPTCAFHCVFQCFDVTGTSQCAFS